MKEDIKTKEQFAYITVSQKTFSDLCQQGAAPILGEHTMSTERNPRSIPPKGTVALADNKRG